VLCKRCWVLLSGFMVPNIAAAPGVTLGTAAAQTGGAANAWALAGAYLPTLPEIVIAVAVFALAALAYIVLYAKVANKA